jgi:prepilin-type processing-associated H-X9-DG protein
MKKNQIYFLIPCIFLLIFLLVKLYQNTQLTRNITSCLTNEKNIGQALHIYCEDNDSFYPPSHIWWDNKLDKNIQGCPSAVQVATFPENFPLGILGYAYNQYLGANPTKQETILYPERTIAVGEAMIGTTQIGALDDGNRQMGYENMDLGGNRHNGSSNVLFCDGHVQRYIMGSIAPSSRETEDICTTRRPTFVVCQRK